MATRYWLGGAQTVAQVDTVQVTGFDAATTYTITIGGIAVSVAGNTDVNTTASDLQVALAAETHAYFAAITWTVSTDTITATADVAGCPFTATSSVTGGTGTIGAVTSSTANSSPHDFNNADNWTNQVAPVNSDTIIFADHGISCVWNTDTSLTTVELIIDQSFTGEIGLDRRSFATAQDGSSLDTSAPEYRAHTLELNCSSVLIGRNITGTSQAGSSRIKLYNSGGGDCLIENTGTNSDHPPLMYRANSAISSVEIRQGTVGLGTDEPSLNTVYDFIDVSGTDPATSVSIGPEVQASDIHLQEGELFWRGDTAVTTTSVNVYGGEMHLDEGPTITTLSVYGGTVVYKGPNNVTTLNMEGGDVDCGQSSSARTIGTLNFNRSGSFTHGDNVTITTFNEGTNGTTTFDG